MSGQTQWCLCLKASFFVFALQADFSSCSQRSLHNSSADHCQKYAALYPTIYDQLGSLLGGISQSQVDQATRWYAQDRVDSPEGAPTSFNYTAATTLKAEDPQYPWSHPYIVKIVSLDGELYLPGGRIPVFDEGFAFASNWYSGVLLLDLLNITDKYGPFPDMEFYVTSGAFPLVHELDESGLMFPVFSSTGSKHFYDLVLPEAPATQFFKEVEQTLDWNSREAKVIGRYNYMCHRGGAPLTLRGSATKPWCVRAAYHDLDQSDLNFDGILDVGLFDGLEEPEAKHKDYLTSAELEKAKYALCLDGATTANRLSALMRSGQLVLLEDHSPLFSHFYGAMQPWKHYVPVGRDSYDDIFHVARYLREHDDVAKQIAVQGQRFAAKYTTREAADCYTIKMLELVGSLVKYKPRPLGPQAITLRKAIELADEDGKWWESVKDSSRSNGLAFPLTH